MSETIITLVSGIILGISIPKSFKFGWKLGRGVVLK